MTRKKKSIAEKQLDKKTVGVVTGVVGMGVVDSMTGPGSGLTPRTMSVARWTGPLMGLGVLEAAASDVACDTPGMKKRSKGKGRGLARGRGYGPIGRWY